MGKLKQTLLTLVLGVMVGGCGTGLTLQSNSTLMKIKPGMSRQEVTGILGNPTYNRFDGGNEQWEYRKQHAITGLTTVVIVNFADGYVTGMDSFDDTPPTLPPPPVAVCPPHEVIAIEPSRPDHGHRHKAMHPQDFENLYNKVKKKVFKDEQMELLSVGTVNNYFTCGQTARLMSLFVWDDDKMKVLNMVSERIVDKKNGEEIAKTFDSLFKQDDARKILGISKGW